MTDVKAAAGPPRKLRGHAGALREDARNPCVVGAGTGEFDVAGGALVSDLVWSHAAGMPRSALLARGGVRVVEGMRELADAVAEAVGAIQARS